MVAGCIQSLLPMGSFDLQIEGFYFVILFLFWLFHSVQITLFGLNYKGDLGIISRER